MRSSPRSRPGGFPSSDGTLDHHLISVTPEEIVERVPELKGTVEQWARRSMLVRRTDPVLVECVVRGYITGSAWKEYKGNGNAGG